LQKWDKQFKKNHLKTKNPKKRGNSTNNPNAKYYNHMVEPNLRRSGQLARTKVPWANNVNNVERLNEVWYIILNVNVTIRGK